MNCVRAWRFGLRRWGLFAAASIAGGALAGVVLGWLARAPMSPCEKEIRFGDARTGIQTCLDRYKRTANHRDLSWAARGYMLIGDFDHADKRARELLTGPLYGDGHRMLSYVALRQGSSSAARMHAMLALVAHRFAGDEQGQASDAVSLSQIAWKVGDFTAALEAADEAARLSRRLRDPVREAAAHLARADALRRMGDASTAARAAARALELATEPCDRAWAHFKSGMCQMELGRESLAMRELAAATEVNRRCGSADLATSIAINEAWLRRWKDPAGSVALLDEAARKHGELFETLLLRSYLAADRGAHDDAERYLAEAERLDAPDADWPWEIARARAELAELRGGPSGDAVAESYYRRSIAEIAALRATARARAAYLVASHRGPFDGLIALLARHGRWRDVLAVVLELDASDMLRATADEALVRDRASLDIDSPSSDAAAPPRASVDEVLSAWRSRDLVAVIASSPRRIGPGHERVYRLRIVDGELTGEDVGDARTARAWAGELFAEPANQQVAQALGRMIVPPGSADRTLHVLAIGALGKVPLAALRDDGSPSIARRPLVRVLGLYASRPESRGTGPPTVIADPRHDLPGAAEEGSVVAAALGPGTEVAGSLGPLAATRERLWMARDAALLHFAGNVGEAGDELSRRRALRLADGDVDPSEMIQRGIAPRIAVLAGCGSAAARDEEGWGSIAAALVEAGTAIVIGTDRSVDDRAALAVMRALYAQRDWRTDPARALARVQQALAARAAAPNDDSPEVRSWATFFALGRPPTVLPHRPLDRGEPNR